jgi:hypothetical protein
MGLLLGKSTRFFTETEVSPRLRDVKTQDMEFLHQRSLDGNASVHQYACIRQQINSEVGGEIRERTTTLNTLHLRGHEEAQGEITIDLHMQ